MNKNSLLTPLVNHYNIQDYSNYIDKIFCRTAPVDVEIGFGMGEVLMSMSKEGPERNFIGIEQHWERLFKTIKAIDRTRSSMNSEDVFGNIRIIREDAVLVFEMMFQEKSIDNIYCLFPCPWPKKGHVRHRLFSNKFLKLINNRLKDLGRVQLVTDFEPYYEWVIEQLEDSGFGFTTQKIPPRFNTKFEKKWRAEGKEEFFSIEMFKEEHVFLPVKKEVSLKSYRIDNFDPDNFKLIIESSEPVRNELGRKDKAVIVFKEFLFDTKKQKVKYI